MTTGSIAVWEQVFRAQAWGKYPPEHVVRFVARRFYAAPDHGAVRLLDAGCGTGASAWFMASEGFAVSGIDGAPTAIERGRARMRDANLDVDLRVGELLELPWPDAHFDGVVMNCVLSHNLLAYGVRAVAEVRRVLKPGGWFLLSEFTDRTWGYGAGTALGDGAFRDIADGPFAGKGLVQLFGRAQIARMMDGLADVEVERTSYTAMQQREVVEQWVAQGRKP